QDFETHVFAPPVRERPRQDFKAIALEVRQPAPVQLEGAAAAALFVGLLRLVLPTFLVRRQERPVMQTTRAFDALAPPTLSSFLPEAIVFIH
ncbi:MAG: hypothetical protein ACK41E_09765, partial [Deinococcales bacterium]